MLGPLVVGERVVGVGHVGGYVERLHQHLQHVDALYLPVGIEAQAVAVERSHAVTIVQVEQCTSRLKVVFVVCSQRVQVFITRREVS